MSPVPFTAKPGLTSPWRSVNEMLRRQYEESAKAIDAVIADRKAKQIPTDDLTDWHADVADLLDKAASANGREAIGALLERALAITNGGLRSLPPFRPDPACEGAEVRLRALSKADVFTMRADLAAVAYDGDDSEKKLRASAAAQLAARPFIAKALVGVRARVDGGALDLDNLTPDSPEMQGALDALDAAGLLGAVFTCAREFQELPVPQREVYGLPRPSISQTDSTAGCVQPIDVECSDAMAVAVGSRATVIERPTGAHAVTSSTSPGSHTPLTFTAPLEASQG